MDGRLACDGGDGVARFEHGRRVGVQIEVALLDGGVAPRDREHLLALAQQPLDHAASRGEVEDVELVDRRRREEQRDLTHRVGLRGILDQLVDLGSVHHGPGGESQVLPDRELAGVDRRGQVGEVVQEVARALEEVAATVIDDRIEHRRVRPGEVAGRQGIEHVSGGEAGLALVAPIEPPVGDQAVDCVVDREVGLKQPPEQPA